jgi:hypothetical protein
MRTLSYVAVEFSNEDTLSVFHRHGARIEGSRVYLDEDQLLRMLDLIPALFKIHARDPERSVVIGDGEVVFAPGYGAMLYFDVAACGKEKAFRCLDAPKVILPATSLGDIYSLIVNLARTTHHWLDDEELARVGISPGTFRMSAGIENIEDLKEDLDQALKACL